MTTIQGTNIHCGIVNTTTNAFAQFAFSKKATISMKRDMQEVSSRGQDKEYIPSRKSWKMTCGCLLSNDESIVWNAYNNGAKITVSWREVYGENGEMREFTGQAYITDIKATGNIHEMAAFDITLQGTGSLTYRKSYPVYLHYTETYVDTGRRNYVTYELSLDNPLDYDLVLSVGSDFIEDVTIAAGETTASVSKTEEWADVPKLLKPTKPANNIIIEKAS